MFATFASQLAPNLTAALTDAVSVVATATTVPVTTPPTVLDAGGGVTPVLPDASPTVTLGEFLSSVWNALVTHGYQTGVATIVAAVAVVAMVNMGTHRLVTIVTGIGAFWAGWLGWNTITGDSNPLFPGQISAVKLWDIAFASPSGFMIVAVVASVTAVFLWRSKINLASRVLLMIGAVLGASFVYNVFEAFRASTGV